METSLKKMESEAEHVEKEGVNAPGIVFGLTTALTALF